MYFFGLFILVLLFVLVHYGRVFPSKANVHQNNTSAKSLNIARNILYRQSYNNCAPYSVMAVINVLTAKEFDPEKLASEITWRLINNVTLPRGIIKLLHNYGIKSKEFNLFTYNDEEKINWIKNTIDQQTPIILLIDVDTIKHYVSVIGYDEAGFMIYDSLQEESKENPRMTIVDEGTNGNRYYSYTKLISLWNKGACKIFFRNWALVCFRDS